MRFQRLPCLPILQTTSKRIAQLGGCLIIISALNVPLALAAYDLQRKSSFAQHEIIRNPFWPVGWRTGGSLPEKTFTISIPPEAFTVSSILLSPPRLAIINGKTYEEGDFIPLTLDDRALSFRVLNILDGAVILGVSDKAVEVKLKRKRLKK